MARAAAAEACGIAFAAALYGYGSLSTEALAKNWLPLAEPTDMIRFVE